MRYFLDTEFIERGHEWPIELISIGVVAEDGRKYYAIASDGFNEAHASDWVKKHVLAHLEQRTSEVWKTRVEIARDLIELTSGDGSVEFWAYFADYDWVVMCQLFGAMIDLPTTFPMWCNDLKQLADALGVQTLPRMPGLIEHNALSDALEVQYRYDWLRDQYNAADSILKNACNMFAAVVNEANGRALNFGKALRLLQDGKRVARAGWNGKGMWLIFVPADRWSAGVGPSRVENAHRLPWIAMKTADGGLVPWLASQTDVLANDWEQVE